MELFLSGLSHTKKTLHDSLKVISAGTTQPAEKESALFSKEKTHPMSWPVTDTKHF